VDHTSPHFNCGIQFNGYSITAKVKSDLQNKQKYNCCCKVQNKKKITLSHRKGHGFSFLFLFYIFFLLEPMEKSDDGRLKMIGKPNS